MNKKDIRDKALKETKSSLTGSADKDVLLVKAVKQFDQLNKDFSQEMERFRDWYAVHFPELEEEITDNSELVNLLDRYGVRKDELEPFAEMAESSKGSKLDEEDIKMLEETVNRLKNLDKLRESLEEYVREGAKEEFQNLSELLGPLLATRVISLAGGLEELAKKPASTVQMLGAEKALFRYLHGEGSPPKHGVIFEHKFVKSLPEDKRGKMARFLANKAVMAARIDQYGDENKSERLRNEVQEKYDELSE